MIRRHSSLIISATLAAIGAFSAVGCSEPVQQEKQGSRTAKLLAPKAIFKAKASADTKKALGIVEWRVFRGQRDMVLTGYDANGKAKKGVSIGFHGASKGVKASLRARILDGTMFAARHEYGGETKTNGQMSKDSASLLSHAFHDARGIAGHLLPSKGEVPLPGTGSLPPSNGQLPQEQVPLPQIPGGAECGGGLMQVVMAAVQCIQQTGNTQMCLAAAQAASSMGGACQQGPLDPNMPPYDPTQQGGPYDQCGGGAGYPGDPMGGMGGYPGEDPMGGGAGGYPGEDPYGGMGGAGGMCGDGFPGGEGQFPGGEGQYPGGMDDPWGDGAGGMCPSCAGDDPYGGGMGGGMDDPYGGMGDIYGDANCGEPGMGGMGGMEGGFGEGW